MFDTWLNDSIISSNAQEAFSLFEKSRFGEKKSGRIIYTPFEALYLLEKQKIQVLNKKEPFAFQKLLNILKKNDKKLEVKYLVYKNLRSKGYIPKTALKFGAEFRVYTPESKIGEEHAKWILYTAKEHDKLSWHDFAAKNRVAHSTNKSLLIAILDDEEDITYYDVSWKKI